MFNISITYKKIGSNTEVKLISPTPISLFLKSLTRYLEHAKNEIVPTTPCRNADNYYSNNYTSLKNCHVLLNKTKLMKLF